MEAQNKTLFIVDDDPVWRKAFAALASSMRINYEMFASAEEFLARYEPSLAGCVLLDYRLGDMDGLQLQEKLRSLDSMLSVVMISAHADVSVVVRAMKNGAVTFIEKPFRQDELCDAVCKALEQSAQVRQLRVELAEFRRRWESLTPQECQMAHLIVGSKSQKQAAQILNVPLSTVNRLSAAVYEKTGVGSAVELAGIVVRLGKDLPADRPLSRNDRAL